MKYVTTKKELKECLQENNILIKYTRDVNGNRNGVVVAIGAHKIGFSKVHPDDGVWNECTPTQTPYFQQVKAIINNGSGVFNFERKLEKYFDLLEKSLRGNESFIPRFDKYIALKTAINRAISGSTGGASIPYSMLDDVIKMHDRSKKYFK